MPVATASWREGRRTSCQLVRWAAPGTSWQLALRSDDLLDRLGAFDADELLVQPAVEVRQPVRVQPELLQHGRVHVLDMEAVLDRRGAEFIGRADADAALDAAAGQPHREAVR